MSARNPSVHYGLTLDLVNPAFLCEKAGLFCNKAGLFCNKAGLFCNKAALLDDKEGLRLIEYFETSKKGWRWWSCFLRSLEINP